VVERHPAKVRRKPYVFGRFLSLFPLLFNILSTKPHYDSEFLFRACQHRVRPARWPLTFCASRSAPRANVRRDHIVRAAGTVATLPCNPLAPVLKSQPRMRIAKDTKPFAATKNHRPFTTGNALEFGVGLTNKL